MAPKILKERLSQLHYERLMALENSKLHAFIAETIELTNPKTIYVCTDSLDDAKYIRELAVKNKEETPLATNGHTYHFDGYYDQGRDKGSTKYLLPKGVDLGSRLSSIDKQTGVNEVRSHLKNSMADRQMLICFWCLGPTNSDFAIPCVQITDSAYVAHSEFILYRPGYEQFRSIGDSPEFFRFIHSAGELENSISKNPDKRCVYIDLEENLVYSVNTQYAGNTVGLKKLALRLAIRKASSQGWLAEHMFVMGIHGPNERVTYFTGAFPSACGKTSTAMIPGQTIIGDDIAYLRKKNGQIRCVNVERGIFGIIQDVNPENDPVIYKSLITPGEVIFGNVLITNDLKPHWLGMGKELSKKGLNHSGQWVDGQKDAEGEAITASHKNARYTISISSLENKDPLADAPEGVPVGGVIYGGRDSDTWVPIEQAFDWIEGVITKGAALESETTAATIGKQGVRSFNLMSNLDFLSIPLGKYVQNHLEFVKDIKKPPLVFAVNYFLKNENGKYISGMLDKKVWILWAELRVNGDVTAIETPSGYIPRYEDLAKLFKAYLKTDYTQETYVKQFTIRVSKLLEKIDRIENIYKTQVSDTPKIVFEVFDRQRSRRKAAKDKYGDFISPFDLEIK